MKYKDNKNRCSWCNPKNALYIKYHDEEWCQLNLSDAYLFELLVLESFQAGLSWECILNKREAFRQAFDNFDPNKIANYSSSKVTELLQNKYIIRNKLKINATITNAKIFKNIVTEYSSFQNYLKSFISSYPIYETNQVSSTMSDTISLDLQKRGMKFVGTKIIYSYLQAIGIIYSHEESCFMFKK